MLLKVHVCVINAVAGLWGVGGGEKERCLGTENLWKGHKFQLMRGQ